MNSWARDRMRCFSKWTMKSLLCINGLHDNIEQLSDPQVMDSSPLIVLFVLLLLKTIWSQKESFTRKLKGIFLLYFKALIKQMKFKIYDLITIYTQREFYFLI